MQLGTGEDLAKHWGLTPAQWGAMSVMPVFTEMVRRATEELASTDGLAEKIRRKAAMAVENGLVDVVAIMVNPQASAATRLEAFSELKELAGLTKNATQQRTLRPCHLCLQQRAHEDHHHWGRGR